MSLTSGRGPGVHGGQIVSKGTPGEIAEDQDSP